jgi:hypothetical protein
MKTVGKRTFWCCSVAAVKVMVVVLQVCVVCVWGEVVYKHIAALATEIESYFTLSGWVEVEMHFCDENRNRRIRNKSGGQM